VTEIGEIAAEALGGLRVQQNNSSDLDQLDDKLPSVPSLDLREEIASIRESLNQTRTEMSLYRRRVERRQLEVDAHIRRTNVLWAVVLLGLVGLGAAVFYGFHSGAVVVPTAQTISVEKKDSGNPATADLQNPISEQSPSPQSEPPQGVKNAPATNETNVIPSAPSQRAAIPAAPPAKLPADTVNRNRIDFEVSRNKTQEVAPGIFLTVRDMNVERQQINGWLQISAEGRTVMLRDQRANKPMVFTTKHDERSHELIFTRVGKQGVTGYLLIPVTSG
jgi:hypothetical protein